MEYSAISIIIQFFYFNFLILHITVLVDHIHICSHTYFTKLRYYILNFIFIVFLTFLFIHSSLIFI